MSDYQIVSRYTIILIKLFKNYNQAIIFSHENSQKYKQIGWLLIWNALLAQPIGKTLSIFGGSLSNPPGQRYITLTYGINNIESLFYGLIIIFISWIMIEGYRLHSILPAGGYFRIFKRWNGCQINT